jgi:hypothetical protein
MPDTNNLGEVSFILLTVSEVSIHRCGEDIPGKLTAW